MSIALYIGYNIDINIIKLIPQIHHFIFLDIFPNKNYNNRFCNCFLKDLNIDSYISKIKKIILINIF